MNKLRFYISTLCTTYNEAESLIENNPNFIELLRDFPFDIKTENFKASLLLLIYAFINSFKTFNHPNTIYKSSNSDKNIEIYAFMANHCQKTKNACMDLKKNWE